MTSFAPAPAVRRRLSRSPGLLSGLVLAAGGGVVGMLVHTAVPLASSVLVAIVLGVALGGATRRNAGLAPGLTFAARRVLRFGVALLGFQLSVGQVVGLGWLTLLCVVVIVAGGITGTMLIGAALGVPRARRLLIACGFSICGAAAVAAVGGVVEPEEEEDIATALGLVVAFGSIAMLVLPAVATMGGLGTRQAGAWLGGSIHEVGQVVVAGGIVGGVALQIAVLVKLSRVLMLGPVLVVLSVRARRAGITVGERRPPLVPLFVVGFAALVVAGSVLPVPDSLRSSTSHLQEFTLAAAMFALGCGVDLRALARLRGTEVLLGLLASVLVAILALPLVLVA